MPKSNSQENVACNSRRTWIVGVTTLVVVLVIHSTISGFAISKKTAERIVIGLVGAEVLEVAGKPHYTDKYGWYYRVWNGFVPYSDMLFVGFDDDGVVNWVSF